MNIDEIAEKIVSSFNAENNVALKEGAKYMLYKINKEECMFSVVKQPYLVAKSLYFMLTEDYLSEDEQISCIKLAYLCLLNNYIKNKDKKTIEPEYENLVSGCKLAIVLISMQGRYLMYSVIAGQAGYINPDVHIRNQMLLFGGIVKEAKIANYNFASEEIIDNYFVEIFKEAYSHLPIGENLGIIKEKSNPIIEKIETSISLNLKEDFLDDF